MNRLLDFDPEHKVLLVTLSENLTEPEYLAVREEVESFLQIEGPCHVILDFRGISKFDASADFVRMLAEKPPTFPAGKIRVGVASQPVVYGMLRMYQMIGDKTRQPLDVVKTMEEAHS